jgi:hypothetical protein
MGITEVVIVIESADFIEREGARNWIIWPRQRFRHQPMHTAI